MKKKLKKTVFFVSIFLLIPILSLSAKINAIDNDPISHVSKIIGLNTASAQSNKILYVGEVEGISGGDVIVPVGINDASGVVGAEMIIGYDKAVLTLKEVKTTALTKDALLQWNPNTPGETIIAIIRANALAEGSATIIDIVFTINSDIKPGTEIPIGFKKALVFDSTPKEIGISTKNGKVTIKSCIKGDINGDGIINSKDAALTLRISAELIIPDEYQRCAGDVNSDDAINSKDALIILRMSAGLLAPSKNEIMSDTVKIAFGEAYSIADDRISIPIKVDKTNLISAGDLFITYNKSVLRAVNISSEEGVLLAYNLKESGIIQISFAGNNSLENNVILNLSFDVLKNNSFDISLKNIALYTFDTSIINIEKKDGKFICRSGFSEGWNQRKSKPSLTYPQNNVLLQNFPNPFNPETWIPYQLCEACDVTISIYNLVGELVRQLQLGYKPAGSYMTQDKAAYWDGKDKFGISVANGVYFYNIKAGKFSAVNKMIILK